MENDISTLSSLGSLLLISVLALFVPIIIHRQRVVNMPVMVGEILCGIIVGKSFLGLVNPDNQLLNILSTLGFTYLMFLGGMELNLSSIIGSKKKLSSMQMAGKDSALFITIVGFLLTLALSYAFSYVMVLKGFLEYPTNPLMLSLLLSTTSVGVALSILKESKSSDTPMGQVFLTMAMLYDFATIVLATLVLIFVAPGERGKEFLAMMALLAAFFFVYRIGKAFMSSSRVKALYMDMEQASVQLRIRTAFALMLLFTLMSMAVGVEFVLGAFVAGMIFRALFKGNSVATERNFDAIGYGFLIPLFFIMVGIRMDISIIWSNPKFLGIMVLLLIVAFGVKIIPSIIVVRRFGLRNAIAGGILLSGNLSLIIAFAEVAVHAKLLQPELEAASILIAVITCILAPIGFLSMKTETAEITGNGILILGAGKVGRSLAYRLQDRMHMTILMDNDMEAVEKARAQGLTAHFYADLSEAALKKAGIEKCDVMVAATNMDKVNFDACMIARRSFNISNLVARIGNPDNQNIFKEHDIKPMDASNASVVAIENLMYRPLMYGLLSHEIPGVEVVEVKVTNRELHGKRIMNIELPGNALVLLVRKENETGIPHGNTFVEIGDTITLFINEDNLLEVTRIFDPGRPDLQIQKQ